MIGRRHSSAFSLLSDFGPAGSATELRDYEAELKAAFEDGHRQGQAEGRAEAEADAEIRLTEAGVRYAEELAIEKQNWEQAFADVLIARLNDAAKLIEHSIETRVASLLKPWLTDRLRDRALEDLERAISRAMSEGAKIHIEAPAGIIQYLRDRLPTGALQIGYSESPGADVRAYIEDTVIEVNISAWIAELETAAT